MQCVYDILKGGLRLSELQGIAKKLLKLTTFIKQIFHRRNSLFAFIFIVVDNKDAK